MKKKAEIKVVINYPMDKEQLIKVEKIKMDGALDIAFRKRKIDILETLK